MARNGLRCGTKRTRSTELKSLISEHRHDGIGLASNSGVAVGAEGLVRTGGPPMRVKMLAVAAVAASGLCLVAVGVAEAAITPSLIGTPVNNGDGTFTWRYNVNLADDQNASSTGATPTASTPAGPGDSSTTFKDYFTLYDFNLFTGVHTQP